MSCSSVTLLFAVLVASTYTQRIAPVIPSRWSFQGGKVIDFKATMDLQNICKAINLAYGKGQLSDAMGSAMKYMHSMNIQPMSAAKPNSGMQCLYTWAKATKGGSGDAGNLFGDLYDTVIEGPHFYGFFDQDPCNDPGFCQCGMQMGMSPPAAMAQMALPGNSLLTPMTFLSKCVKKNLCAFNPNDWRCSGNPMMHPRYRVMMNAMTAIRRGMNPMAGMNRMAGMNGMAGTNPMAYNMGASPAQSAAPVPAQPQYNMSGAPAPNQHMAAAPAPAHNQHNTAAAPAYNQHTAAAPAYNQHTAAAPAQNQNMMGGLTQNLMSKLFANQNFLKTFMSFMQQNMANQNQQYQSSVPQQQYQQPMQMPAFNPWSMFSG